VASEPDDPTIDRLAGLFLEHPAWIGAARRISPKATCGVYFTHRPGEAWRLEQVGVRTRLRPGAAADPDLVFRFTPASIERLAAVCGGIGDFAVALFGLMVEDDPELRVDLRIAASFRRLARRGYVRLLLDAGPAVVRFGASHGIRTLPALRSLVSRLRRREPEDWEIDGVTPG
jgi:hypothetical protein